MCNHFRADPSKLETWRVWSGHGLRRPNAETKADVWPKYPALVIRRSEDRIVSDAMRWGVPTTVPGKRAGVTLEKHVTNCRNHESPFWQSMMAAPAQRCLVPFTEFAEPRPGKDAETGRPAEWWFTLDQPVGAFAGIWRRIGDTAHFAFLTTAPNALVEPLHPKAMPVILNEGDYEQWLTGDREAACSLIQPFPAERMRVN